MKVERPTNGFPRNHHWVTVGREQLGEPLFSHSALYARNVRFTRSSRSSSASTASNAASDASVGRTRPDDEREISRDDLHEPAEHIRILPVDSLKEQQLHVERLDGGVAPVNSENARTQACELFELPNFRKPVAIVRAWMKPGKLDRRRAIH